MHTVSVLKEYFFEAPFQSQLTDRSMPMGSGVDLGKVVALPIITHLVSIW